MLLRYAIFAADDFAAFAIFHDFADAISPCHYATPLPFFATFAMFTRCAMPLMPPRAIAMLPAAIILLRRCCIADYAIIRHAMP